MKRTSLFLLLCLALAGTPGFAGAASVKDARLQATAAPVPRSPSDGVQFQSLTAITLTWDLPPGATQYHIQVIPFNNDGPGINLIRDAATSYTIEPPVLGKGPYVILPGMSYTWRLRATEKTTSADEGDASWGAWSSDRKFTTPPATAASITPIEPPTGATTPGLTPMLQWTDGNGFIFYYELQLSKDQQFRTDPATATAAVYMNLVHGGEARPANSWTVPGRYPLEPATRYYWRLRPRVQGNGQASEWSALFYFNTPERSSSSPSASPRPSESPKPSESPRPSESPKPSEAPRTACVWDGLWNSNRGAMSLTQQGNGVYGPVEGGKKVSGTLDGRYLKGTWAEFEPGSDRIKEMGKFIFGIAADCHSFTGRWGRGESDSDGGMWEGNRYERPAPSPSPSASPSPSPSASPSPTPSPSPAAVRCSYEGKWRSTAGLMTIDVNDQGTGAYGTYERNNGKFSGSVDGSHMRAGWVEFARGGDTVTDRGRFNIVLTPDCNYFTGRFSRGDSDDDGGEFKGYRLPTSEPSPSPSPSTSAGR